MTNQKVKTGVIPKEETEASFPKRLPRVGDPAAEIHLALRNTV